MPTSCRMPRYDHGGIRGMPPCAEGNILIDNKEPKTAVDRSPDRDRSVAVSDSEITIPQPASPVKAGGYEIGAVKTEDGYAVRVTVYKKIKKEAAPQLPALPTMPVLCVKQL